MENCKEQKRGAVAISLVNIFLIVSNFRSSIEKVDHWVILRISFFTCKRRKKNIWESEKENKKYRYKY